VHQFPGERKWEELMMKKVMTVTRTEADVGEGTRVVEVELHVRSSV
jgi:hypothetical protein